MYHYSEMSMNKLKTADSILQEIMLEVIDFIDNSIITGHRTKKEQDALYPKYTKLKWPKGKHNKLPSKALDVAPFIEPYGTIVGSDRQIQDIMYMTGKSKAQVNDFILKAYARLIGYIERVAHEKGVNLRVGLDWDGDWDILDQSFHDLGHIELVD